MQRVDIVALEAVTQDLTGSPYADDRRSGRVVAQALAEIVWLREAEIRLADWCDAQDVLSKGESPTTKAVRDCFQ